MAQLLLRGEALGANRGSTASIQAVLFDKDGTLSHSEPMLQRLALARIQSCLALVEARLGPLDGTLPGPLRATIAGLPNSPPAFMPGNTRAADISASGGLPGGGSTRATLIDLLQRAYGIDAAGIHPGGITAVAARDHNLIATATALTQVGLIWPDALAIAEASFEATDGLDGSLTVPEPTAGLAALLERLTNAGLSCAVISNDHRQGIRAFLEGHGLADRFAASWSADDQPRKPSAGAVWGLCERLGIQPERCALVGDAASDLRMARSAGLPIALGYRSGWRRPPELDPGSLCLEHWQELDATPD